MTSICVLLATKNGALFIQEFLESLIAQQVSISEVLVSDDSSTDGTLDIIRQTLSGKIEFQIIKGQDLGSTQNFFYLLREASKFNFFAFADQDDVWAPFHLRRAVEKLQNYPSTPALVYSPTSKSYKNLLRDTRLKPVQYRQFLLNNPSRGCTIIFNNEAKELINSQETIAVLYHDWFVTLLVALYGKVFAFNKPSVYYREHAGQQIGPQRKLSALPYKIRRFPDSLAQSKFMCTIISKSVNSMDVKILKNIKIWCDFLNSSHPKVLKGLETIVLVRPRSSSRLRTFFSYLYLFAFCALN